MSGNACGGCFATTLVVPAAYAGCSLRTCLIGPAVKEFVKGPAWSAVQIFGMCYERLKDRDALLNSEASYFGSIVSQSRCCFRPCSLPKWARRSQRRFRSLAIPVEMVLPTASMKVHCLRRNNNPPPQLRRLRFFESLRPWLHTQCDH